MDEKKIRILIADDHAIVRTGLTALLGTVPGMEVVGEAKDGEEAVRLTDRLAPDVVIMDLVMPKKNGVVATRELKERSPSSRVLVLTSFGSSDELAEALEAGAAGAIMKNSPNKALIDAIRTVASGRSAVSSEVRKLIASDPPAPELTPRQKEVLDSLSRGLTNRDIACQLSIGEDRVEQHIRALLTKLGAANRTEAVAIALRKHLLKI